MCRVFITYRRSDSQHVVGRLVDHLAERIGASNVFKDVDSIPLGDCFRQTISRAIESSDVVLAVVGETWAGALQDDGEPRLNDPNDFVRIEIESALQQGIPLIPVLVGSARLPPASTLPESIRELCQRQAAVLRPDPDFARDAARIAEGVRRLAAGAASASMRPRGRLPAWLVRGALAVAVLTIAAGTLWSILSRRDPEKKSGSEDHVPPSVAGPVQPAFVADNVGNRVALVVGVGRQDRNVLTSLPYASRDATRMTQALTRKGFTIVECPLHPTKDEILTAVERFDQRLSAGGVGVFYFSGHGCMVDGDQYLIPRDLESLNSDAIRSGAVKVANLMTDRNSLPVGALSNKGEVVFSAASPGSFAYDDEEAAHSEFARAILPLIDQGELELTAMLTKVRRDIAEHTNGKQLPWLRADTNSEFYFSPPRREKISRLRVFLIDACHHQYPEGR